MMSLEGIVIEAAQLESWLKTKNPKSPTMLRIVEG